MEAVDTAPPCSAPIAEEEIPATETMFAPPSWNPLTRIGFRIAFIYFCCFIYFFGNDSVFYTNYLSYPWMSQWLNWPMNQIAMFAGHHIFHLTHVPSHWEVSTRGDSRINAVLETVFLGASVIGGLIWTAIAMLRRSRRTEYRTLLSWIRFFLRLAVGFFMVGYGMIKVFPLQMGPIPTAVLNEPFGQLWPSTLIWSMMGLHPLYESICGVTEVVAGALLLFRRTALTGALLSIFLIATVVSYNFFFHITIRLFALNLLLAAIFLAVPDTNSLLDFFWRHKPAMASESWAPTSTHRGVRMYVRLLEIVFIVASLIVIPYADGAIWHKLYVSAHVPTPIVGAWHLDAAHPATGPFLSKAGPVTDVYIDNPDRANARFADGMISGGYTSFLTVNPARHTAFVNYPLGGGVAYRWELLDANHLLLTPILPKTSMPGAKTASGTKSAPATVPGVLTFTRITLPAHYRLLE